MGELLARCGIKPKRPTSARQARSHRARIAAVTGGSNPGIIYDSGNALYVVGGNNGIDEALLRKRLGVGLANVLIRAAPARVPYLGRQEETTQDDDSDGDGGLLAGNLDSELRAHVRYFEKPPSISHAGPARAGSV